ncbi:AP-5 complex subunit zeta-1-like isoform X1 [Neltuma alba]|uniref:AP-5 complex subunit zeta-1-like isoform X1 n=1 Tax=Neltuma alba TaxID=207710 RepID=UPI0010A56B6B|nr:AP-5 complex subunit zeta-1-like isoform X1 [Prosopis alba]XP_028807756.1 AP-5 complex subunit zeta-1-like isoform X1 [Prosopis alba]
MTEQDGNWDFHLRTLSNSARDSNTANDPASDPALLQSVKKLHEICVAENSEDLVARVYPQINKIFQRAAASLSHSRTSNGLLLLAILQFYLDFGEVVLHDADPSLRIFFRSCLSREFADPVVAGATLEFLIVNRKKFTSSFLNLLPQFFPLLLKLVAWHGERLGKLFLKVLPGLISSGSFLPLFISLVDLPILVVALEKVEKSSGPLIGTGIASIQQNTAPKMLLALMDEAYTGSTIEDGAGDSESEDNSAIDVDSPLFLELLKDENDGLAERHWTSPGMAALLQAAVNSPYSDRLKQALILAPPLLDVYFSIALHEVNESLMCALIPLLMSRYSTIFPDKNFSHEVHKRILEFMLSAFQHSPNFIALLKKPIIDRVGEAYDSPEKTELALQLCWAIGEHGGGGGSHKDEARELFESLELLLYENLSTSRLGLRQDVSRSSNEEAYSKSSQSRLLCFVVTAIAKLATHHRELLPRARVSLGKVARSQISDARVWTRARDFLGLMNDPAICSSILGPSRPSQGTMRKAGSINWNEGSRKMIAHVPFYLLGELEGAPFHDFSFSDIIPRR